jgi:hypothetical protein
VMLPEYFESINRDATYQLTPIGAAMPTIHIASEVASNRFRIGGGAPGMRVSWSVTAIRNDAWTKTHAVRTEWDKPEAWRGKLLTPTAWGQPPEAGIFWRSRRGFDPIPDPMSAAEIVRPDATDAATPE